MGHPLTKFTKEQRMHKAFVNGNIRSIKHLMKCGVKIDNNFIATAASRGHLILLKYLRSIGYDILHQDIRAIWWASFENRLDVVKYLVSIGADVTIDNNIAVSWSIAYNRLQVVKYLVSVGAKVNYTCAISTAKEFGYKELLNYLTLLEENELSKVPRSFDEVWCGLTMKK